MGFFVATLIFVTEAEHLVSGRWWCFVWHVCEIWRVDVCNTLNRHV